MRKINRRGKDLIKSFEGHSLRAYLCPANVWTISYGLTRINNRAVRQGDVITAEESERLFDIELSHFERGVESATRRVSLNDNQFAALVSFAFNVGLGALNRSTLLRKVLANPADPTIRAEFMRWNRANGKEIRGLTVRRQRESDLYFSS